MDKMKTGLLIVSIVLCSFNTGRSQSPLNIQFRSQLPYGSTVDLSNIWGYVDSLGNEYALVGTQTGLSIVDVTNPVAPVLKFQVPGTNSIWREVQTWGKYAYVTTEGCCNGLQIVDLSNLPASINSKFWTGTGAVAGQVGRIHSLHIRDGYVYLNGSQLFGGAALIVSLNDPWNPVYVSNTAMNFAGNIRYVHDCYVKNDTLWGAHIYGGFFSAINISNKSNPVLISTQNTPNNFTHNAWMADNGSSVLYTTDEVSNSYLASYDVSNTGNIQLLDRLQGMPGSGSIIHNTYIRNSYAINSYYKDGITIVDVSRPENMITVGRYDTYTQGAGNGFNGAWGVYPYLPSGNIIVSDIDNGLFVLTPTYQRACYLEGITRDSCTNMVLSNVSVVITGGTHHAELSKLTGTYKTGTANSGLYTVTFSKTGYTTKVLTGVSLQSGVLTNLNVALRPANAVTYAGALVSNVNCNGANGGAIDLSVVNGTAPITYIWSNGGTAQDLNNIPAGNFTVTVSDGLGCSISQSFTVIEPPAVSAVATVEAVSCSLAQDGALMVQVNGGVAPYTYQWNASPAAVQSPGAQSTLRTSGSSAGNTISGNLLLTGDSTGIDGIPAGNYQLVITDNNGCVTTNNYVLVDPPNPCSISISLRLFIEGFYDGNQTMNPVANASAGITDTVTLELHETVAPYGVVQSVQTAIDSSGWGTFVFPASLWQQSFYLVIKHRNSLETWSKTPFHLPTGVQQFNLTDSFVPVIGNPFLTRESNFKD